MLASAMMPWGVLGCDTKLDLKLLTCELTQRELIEFT